jgi:glutamyl-tRNA synthetase
VYAHIANILGTDGKKLSKRHGAVSVDEFRLAGYLPEALVNFLALIGWAPDGETTIMSREEIVERFTLAAVSASPGTFDHAKLDWMNGVYLRALAPDAYADEVVAYLGERGLEWPEDRVRAMAPLVQEKVGRLGEIPGFTRFLFEDVDPEPDLLDRRILQAAEGALAVVDDWTASELEAALKRLCEGLGEKPRTVFAPIRVAVTGSRVSPGLYESLELLGRETTLERLRRGEELAA